MKHFARVTTLSNIAGRGRYISNPRCQEEIVLMSPSVDWRPYQAYEAAHRKTSKKNNEGREVVVSLPNAWYGLPKDELMEKASQIAQTAAGKDTDLQWAIHWNENRNNFHIHVIFSERKKEKNPGHWDRDIYLTSDGKVARKKADRARLPDGSIAPPVHRKGELKDPFTIKDHKYTTRAWLYSMKNDLKSLLLKFGATFEAPDPLHQYHEGRGSEAPIIRKKNKSIRYHNAMIRVWKAKYPELSENELKDLSLQAVQNGTFLDLSRNHAGEIQVKYLTRNDIMRKTKQTSSLKKMIKSAEKRSAEQNINRSNIDHEKDKNPPR